MLLLGNVQASEDLPGSAAPVGLAKWSSGLVEDTMKSVKSGRPRLDSNPDFVRRFATVLPSLTAGAISQGQAARELGISVRSLKRYAIKARTSSTPAEPCGGVCSGRG